MKIGYIVRKGIQKLFLGATFRECNIDKTAKAGMLSNVTRVKMGKYSYIGNNTSVTDTDIGSYVSISSMCCIGGGAHPMEWVSSSPVFTKNRSILGNCFNGHEYQTHKKTVIGNDVWIGAHCCIKSGVKIGDGAVIVMGSIVTKDVGPYEIWAGNPAKLIRMRFDEETIQHLLESAWWKYPDQEIKRYLPYMNDVISFLDIIAKH